MTIELGFKMRNRRTAQPARKDFPIAWQLRTVTYLSLKTVSSIVFCIDQRLTPRIFLAAKITLESVFLLVIIVGVFGNIMFGLSGVISVGIFLIPLKYRLTKSIYPLSIPKTREIE